MEIKYSKEIPEIYWKCKEVFGVEWDKGIIITYGNIIYCKWDLDFFKTVHEATHVKQQTEMDKDLWWDRYFADKEFRLSQEVEAYQNEINFIKANIKDRNKRFLLINKVHKDISSYIYGNIISFNEARALLK